MNVIKNFLNSEKAIAAGLLVISATALAIAGQITIQEWMDYTEVVLAIYVGGKSIQGAAAMLGKARAVKHPAETPPLKPSPDDVDTQP